MSLRCSPGPLCLHMQLFPSRSHRGVGVGTKALRSSSTSSRPSFRSRRAPKANCYHRAIAKWATDFSVLKDCNHHKIVLASETRHYRAPTLEYAAPPSPHHQGLCPSHCDRQTDPLLHDTFPRWKALPWDCKCVPCLEGMLLSERKWESVCFCLLEIGHY